MSTDLLYLKTMNSARRSQSLNYQRFTPSGYKDFTILRFYGFKGSVREK